VTNFLSFKYFGWFAGGAFCYLYYLEKKKKYILLYFVVSLLNVLSYKGNFSNLIGSSIICIVFIFPICFDRVAVFFDNKVILFLGFISYPLYLIHEDAMIALIVKLNTHFPFIPGWCLPIIPFLALCGIAYIVARVFEPNVRRVLKDVGGLPRLLKRTAVQ
jgi:peptidoglycan/LPS O-acetylase OafA/YrhL